MKWFVFLALIAGSVLTGVVRSVLAEARSFDDDDDVWDDDDDGDWTSGFRHLAAVPETGNRR